MRMNRFLLTDTELELMGVIWNKKSASASQVQMQMVREGKGTAYTTVKTMLDRLVKAGICKSRITGKRSYHYSPVFSREAVAREWYKHLNSKIYA